MSKCPNSRVLQMLTRFLLRDLIYISIIGIYSTYYGFLIMVT